MSFVIRRHYWLTFIQWFTFLTSVTSIDMSHANIRRHLRESELWRAVGMMLQGATFRPVGVAFDVHHTVITRAWERYRIHGTPARIAIGRQRVASPTQHGFLVVQGFRQQRR
jgi:hypothetical protein